MNSDIHKSSPKIKVPDLNKPNYNLSNADIEGSLPKFNNIKTNRQVNPLNPEYILPSANEFPVQAPKFLRDSINVNVNLYLKKDIEGTRPMKKYHKIKSPLDKNSNKDIEGSWTKPLKQVTK